MYEAGTISADLLSKIDRTDWKRAKYKETEYFLSCGPCKADKVFQELEYEEGE